VTVANVQFNQRRVLITPVSQVAGCGAEGVGDQEYARACCAQHAHEGGMTRW